MQPVNASPDKTTARHLTVVSTTADTGDRRRPAPQPVCGHQEMLVSLADAVRDLRGRLDPAGVELLDQVLDNHGTWIEW